MRPKNWVISIVAGLAIGISLVATGLANSFLHPVPVSAQSPVTDVISLMRNSHAKWSSVSMDATTVWYTDAGTQNVNMSVQIQQPNKVNAYSKQTDESGNLIVDYLWMTDGDKIYEQNNMAKTYTVYDAPEFARLSFEEFSRSMPKADVPVIARHPIAILMPSPMADYIYPTGLAQRTGKYSLEPSSQALGKPAFVLDYQNNDSSQLQKYWVDMKTGMILKAQTYGQDNKPFEETTVTNIMIDATIPGESFVIRPPDDFVYVPLEDFRRR